MATLPESASTVSKDQLLSVVSLVPEGLETVPSTPSEASPQIEGVEEQSVPTPSDWQGDYLTGEEVRESLEGTDSAVTSSGEQQYEAPG